MDYMVDIIKIAAYVGAGISVGIASVSAGWGEGFTAGQATAALARQPKAGDNLLRNMLVSQAITETGAIFALVVSLLLMFGGFDKAAGGWYKTAALFAAGVAMGFGSIGPGMGSGRAGAMAIKSIGRMPKHAGMISGNMLIGQALTQTDAIFALLVSLLLLYSTPNQPQNAAIGKIIVQAVAFLGAGFSIGIATIGPANGVGFAVGRANDMLGRYPEKRGMLMRTMFVGSAVSESTAIYALVISFLLMFGI